MASRLLHYLIGVEISKIRKVSNINRFFMGNLLPDASSHMDKSYNKAHFQEKTKDGLKKGINWMNFVKKYKSKILEDSLYQGYLCHLVTDAIWSYRLTDKYIRIYPKEERQGYIKKGYDDFIRLNTILIQNYYLETIDLDYSNHDIVEVDDKLVYDIIEAFIEDFTHKEEDGNSGLQVYPYEVILQFISESINICNKVLTELNHEDLEEDMYKYYINSKSTIKR